MQLPKAIRHRLPVKQADVHYSSKNKSCRVEFYSFINIPMIRFVHDHMGVENVIRVARTLREQGLETRVCYCDMQG